MTAGRPPLTDDPDWTARFREMWDSGVSVKQIAYRLGCGKQTILSARRRLGLPSRYQIHDEQGGCPFERAGLAPDAFRAAYRGKS